MTDAEVMRAALIEGAIGGAAVAVTAFLLSRFIKDIVGRTLLVSALFAGAGAYFGFAFNDQTPRVWLLIELLQVTAYGTLGLYGWRGSPFWLALGWLLHPIWDFGLHYLGPGLSFAPLRYAFACISFDWVVAAYIFIAYRWLHLANRQAPSRAR